MSDSEVQPTKDLAPVGLEKIPPSTLAITWSDGSRREYSYRELQDACPCASCREKRTKPAAPASPFTIISTAETSPLTLVGMKPVGRYAYAIGFNYGCSQGIYTFDFLRTLGKETVKPAAM